jgi:hypothetical protein
MAKTNFFQGLEALGITGIIKMTFDLSPEKVWSVTFMIADAGITDPAMNKIIPLTLTGTSLDLGEGFFGAVAAPVEVTKTLMTNVRQYEKSVAESTKASKVNQTPGKSGPTPPKTSPKYIEKMKKVAELEAKGKYGEAIGLLPKASEFPEKKGEIEAKLKELKQKHGGLSLFPETPATDSSPAVPESETATGQEIDPDPDGEDDDADPDNAGSEGETEPQEVEQD